MVDVMAVARAMWTGVLAAQVRARMAEALRASEEEAGWWISWWAGLHDIGKAAPGFQGKWPEAKGWLQGLGLRFPPVSDPAPHGTVTAAVLADEVLGKTGLCREAAVRVATAVAGHHGVFPRPGEWLDLASPDLGDRRWAAARAETVDLFAETAGCGSKAPSPDPQDEAFFVLLAGLTSVADWIASAEEWFPYEDAASDLDAYRLRAASRAELALDKLGWTRWEPGDARDFREVFDFEPNEVQRAVLAVGEGFRQPSLVIVEAPMGCGKTEAAYWLADRWLNSTGLGGSYIALPTEATSNQMFMRTRAFLGRRFPGERVNLHLVHGHAALSGLYRELRLSAVAGGHQAGVVAEEWFTPSKRALLARYGVGTVDQALLSVLRVRHGFVRLFGLAGKAVVVDEVHAYDTYMSTLLERLLAWLRALGSSVILLSATLPRARRVQLIEAFSGPGVEVRDAPYPRVTWVSGTSAGSTTLGATPSKEVGLQWVGGSTEAIADRLAGLLEGGGCVAWICNTVGRAQEVYCALKERFAPGEVVLFHARYPYEEREEREHRVIRMFGRDGTHRPRRSVLVATQVVEQSLDVDFDLMLTDMAPVDLVLQRSGRLHRHEHRTRPAAVRTPMLWLLEPDMHDGIPRFGESAEVYEEYLLLRSWLALKRKDGLILPTDIEGLIEQVYGDAELPEVPDAVRQQLIRSRGRMEANRDKQEGEARWRVIRTPWREDGLLGMFEADLEEDDPTVHVGLQALTRLGEPSVEVVCLHETDGRLVLYSDGSHPVDPTRVPDLDMVGKLLRRTVRLAHRGVVPLLLRQGVPPGWERCAFLRHHRILSFRDGCCRLGGWQVLLDGELGLVIRRGDEHA